MREEIVEVLRTHCFAISDEDCKKIPSCFSCQVDIILSLFADKVRGIEVGEAKTPEYDPDCTCRSCRWRQGFDTAVFLFRDVLLKELEASTGPSVNDP